MAQILIRLHTKALGDIVTIQEDEWKWGKKEGAPNFAVIQLPGVSASKIWKYRLTDGHNIKYRWKVNLFTMREELVDKLLALDTNKSNRIVLGTDVTWEEFRKHLLDKITNTTEDDNKEPEPRGR